MAADASDVKRSITRGERTRLVVLYWGFVVACLVFAAIGWRLVREQEAPMQRVRPVAATVDRVTVVAHSDSRRRMARQPVVLYSYQVNGIHYSTDRVTLRNASRSGHWADDIASRFRVGQRVTAYYDPANPGSAFLIPERNWLIYASFLIPLGLAIILAALWPGAMRGVTVTEIRAG